jgi:3-hydroxyacyl-CoA dehydrogenase
MMIALKDVADAEDIDRTWMVATNQESGPFGLLASMGVERFLEVSRNIQSQFGPLPAEQNELIETYIKQL